MVDWLKNYKLPAQKAYTGSLDKPCRKNKHTHSHKYKLRSLWVVNEISSLWSQSMVTQIFW